MSLHDFVCHLYLVFYVYVLVFLFYGFHCGPAHVRTPPVRRIQLLILVYFIYFYMFAIAMSKINVYIYIYIYIYIEPPIRTSTGRHCFHCGITYQKL